VARRRRGWSRAKAIARAAGLSATDAARISGHSTSVGAAQDMLRYDEQLPSIMAEGVVTLK
jgi:hypothetical protein